MPIQIRNVTSCRRCCSKKEGPERNSNLPMLPPQKSNTLALHKKELLLPVTWLPGTRALSVDRRVEAWPKIPSIGMTRRPAPGRSRGCVVRLQRCTLFGPEILTQGDIAEADVFNVTWTRSSISRERVLPFRYSP